MTRTPKASCTQGVATQIGPAAIHGAPRRACCSPRRTRPGPIAAGPPEHACMRGLAAQIRRYDLYLGHIWRLADCLRRVWGLDVLDSWQTLPAIIVSGLVSMSSVAECGRLLYPIVFDDRSPYGRDLACGSSGGGSCRGRLSASDWLVQIHQQVHRVSW